MRLVRNYDSDSESPDSDSEPESKKQRILSVPKPPADILDKYYRKPSRNLGKSSTQKFSHYYIFTEVEIKREQEQWFQSLVDGVNRKLGDINDVQVTDTLFFSRFVTTKFYKQVFSPVCSLDLSKKLEDASFDSENLKFRSLARDEFRTICNLHVSLSADCKEITGDETLQFQEAIRVLKEKLHTIRRDTSQSIKMSFRKVPEILLNKTCTKIYVVLKPLSSDSLTLEKVVDEVFGIPFFSERMVPMEADNIHMSIAELDISKISQKVVLIEKISLIVSAVADSQISADTLDFSIDNVKIRFQNSVTTCRM